VHICCFCKYFSLCVFVVFVNIFLCAMLLIGHNLHHICGLHVIDMFNLFEHYISLKIPVFNSCVELKRLHVFDPFFYMYASIGSVRYEI
jgi:hypothetical protein